MTPFKASDLFEWANAVNWLENSPYSQYRLARTNPDDAFRNRLRTVGAATAGSYVRPMFSEHDDECVRCDQGIDHDEDRDIGRWGGTSGMPCECANFAYTVPMYDCKHRDEGTDGPGILGYATRQEWGRPEITLASIREMRRDYE